MPIKSFTLRLRGNNGTAVGDGFRDGKQTRFKCGYYVVLPVFQLSPSLAGRQQFYPSADFAEGQDTSEKRLFRRGLQPSVNMSIRFPCACKLGKNIGIQQKAGHRSTGLGSSFRLSRFSSEPAKGGWVRRS